MAASLVGFAGIAVPAEPEGDLLPPLPQWDSVISLKAGGGYKDNVFLAHTAPQASSFLSTSTEVMVMRLAPDGPQVTAFANAEANYFPDTSPAHREHTVFGQALIEQDFNERVKASIAAQYFYQDQFLDVSVSETSRAAVAVRGHTLTPRPGVRLALTSQSWVALEAPVTRQYFESPLDDYWETGPKLILGRSFGPASQVTVSYEPTWRLYDADAALTTDGLPIAGTHRSRLQHDARLAWRQHWDEVKHWRSTMTLGGRVTEENGGGFTDYTRWFASAQILYRARPWQISAEGRVGHYDYHNQTVSPTDLSKRRRTEWSAALRVERSVGKHLTLAAGYEHQAALSNDVWETYAVNTVGGSAQWEF